MKITRMAMLVAALMLILIGGIWLVSVLRRAQNAQHEQPAQPAGTESPYSKNELQGLIKTLSSTDADERKRAETELANAGVFADEALKAAEAQATGAAKESIQRLLNRRRFAGLSDLDYASALPENSLACLHVPDIQLAIEKSKQTMFGKLVQRPAFDALRKKKWDEMRRDENGEFHQPPLEYFKGQFAIALFQTAPGNIEKNAKLGVLLEMKGSDPQGEYLEWSGKLLNSGGAIVEYKNIECLDAGPKKGAHARTGNHILFGSDADALHALIDTVLGGRGIGEAYEVKEIRKTLGSSPDGVLLVDVPGLVNQILISRAGEKKNPDDDLAEMLLEHLGYAGLSTTCQGDGFEERLVWLFPTGPGEIVAALTAPKGAPPPVEAFRLVPADAVAAAMGYVDGAKLEQAAINYYNEVRKLRGADKMPEANLSPVFAGLRFIEKIFNLKPGELLGLIKGEAGAWVELKPGKDWTQAEIGAVLTAVDNKSAEELATILDKMNASQPPGVFTKNAYNKRWLRSVNSARNGETGKALTWAVDQNRVYFASSLAALKGQLDNLDLHLPGLYKREPLQKALGGFSAADRMGNAIYADMQTLLTRAAEMAIPQVLSDETSEKEVKDALSQLPPPMDLFKDFPPLLAMTVSKKDRGELIVHGPVPLIPLAAMVIMGNSRKQLPQTK